MAKAEFKRGFKRLRGKVGGFVFKHYASGVVVTRVPRMEGVKPSPAQLAQRERFRAAGRFHRAVLADPVLRRRYAALARRRGLPISAVTLAAYLRQNEPPRPTHPSPAKANAKASATRKPKRSRE